jgi:hypothetical protein
MKIFRNVVLLTLVLTAAAFAQLPVTCTQTPNSIPTFVPTVSGGLQYFGVCVGGTVYQVPLIAVSNSLPGAAPIGNLPPFVPEAMTGKSLLKYCHAQYNFAVDGGAISTITPTNGCTLPLNGIVVNSYIYVSTAGVGASGTMSIGWGSGGNKASLLGATAVASLTTASFQQSLIVPQTASTFIHLAAAAPITVTITTTAFTAGVVDIWVEYIGSPV